MFQACFRRHPLRLNFRLSSSTTSSLTDDLRDRILVYRSPLRKLDTSSNQLCASFDKVRASDKLLSLRLAGNCGVCGQSTLGGCGFTAHPVNVIRQRTDASESRVALLPRVDEGLILHSFFLTILLLKRLRAGCIVLAKGRDILAVERCGILVASNKKSGTQNEHRQQFPRFHLTSATRLCRIHNVDYFIRLTVMTSSLEVISILKENGWIHVRTTGSHHIFKHPTKPGHVTVPHPRKDLTMKTLKSIERQSGLSLR